MNPNSVVTAAQRQAFTRLYEDQYERLFRFVLRRVDNHADAADLTAETFRRAWERGLHERTVPGSAWLFATARNTIGDLYRSRERSGRLATRLAEPGDLTSAVADFDGVYGALDSLAEADRELLRLRYWDDLDAAEIAGILGVSAAALWVRLHRARRRFSESYKSIERGSTS
ncbi:sigma-70 family RNA polymerase sigma factor [Mycetocola tolaasinivorans]|uniref:Sigma-70 family RNA polymerase sigma factor n=1 Tax=Mycetocola tolaasinivorans TaxID=76635 RepID=A0A3L7A178_9MICO|nr:sigma-70 family RNA polymerase sigma factor [Mycetocola tolaasinivorans]RLP73192.1 sigma-70 family RNA polymerase sigma factor [Mycetocola tolaasinivorans]